MEASEESSEKINKWESFLVLIFIISVIAGVIGFGVLVVSSATRMSTTTTTVATEKVSSESGLNANDIATGLLVHTALKSSGLFK